MMDLNADIGNLEQKPTKDAPSSNGVCLLHGVLGGGLCRHHLPAQISLHYSDFLIVSK